jgi:hypothetical protein
MAVVTSALEAELSSRTKEASMRHFLSGKEKEEKEKTENSKH